MARELGSKVVMPKDWWKSKTVWFNILSGVVGIALALKAPEVGLPPSWKDVLGVVVVIGNMALRMITGQPIKR